MKEVIWVKKFEEKGARVRGLEWEWEECEKIVFYSSQDAADKKEFRLSEI